MRHRAAAQNGPRPLRLSPERGVPDSHLAVEIDAGLQISPIGHTHRDELRIDDIDCRATGSVTWKRDAVAVGTRGEENRGGAFAPLRDEMESQTRAVATVDEEEFADAIAKDKRLVICDHGFEGRIRLRIRSAETARAIGINRTRPIVIVEHHVAHEAVLAPAAQGDSESQRRAPAANST